MSLLTNIGLIAGIGATTLGYGSFAIKDATSSQNKGDWDWQYKGKLFEDRVGNFSLFSDNKSRYNDYLRGYGNAPKVGYSFDLSGIDITPSVQENNMMANISSTQNESLITDHSSYSTKIGTQFGQNYDSSFIDFVTGAKQLLAAQYSYSSVVPEVAAIESIPNKEVLIGQFNYKENNNLGVLDNKNYITRIGDPQRKRSSSGTSYALDKNSNFNFVHSKVTQITDAKGIERVRFDSKPLGFGSLQQNILSKISGQPDWVKKDTYFETSHPIIVSETKDYLNKLKEGKSNIGRDEGNKYVFSDDEILKEISKDIDKVKEGGNIIIETASFEDSLTTKHPLIKSILKASETNNILIVGGSENKSSMPDYLKTGKIKTAKGLTHRNIVIVEQKDETIAYVGNSSRFTSSDIGEVGVRISSKEFPNEIAFLKKSALLNEADPERFMRELQVTNISRQKGVHNQLLRPLYDQGKDYQGLVITNKRNHSEQFELARYNASMRASGRFTSVVDAEDMGTYESILRASKTDNRLSNEEIAVAKAFDYAVNTPSLISRINEFFFIPAGMGRVLQEEKGPIPSLFGAVGALIDQSYITNNPVLRSYKEDGENYFTTKTTFFQDLLSGSAATLIASASSIGVYLAVGEPLKVLASKALLDSQYALIKAADTNNAAKWALGGTDNDNIGFKMSVIERQINGNKSAYYALENPSFSLYYLHNYQRQRGASFFAATAKEFLISKINPYKHNSEQSKALISSVNDYLEVLQSPADIKIYNSGGEVITHGEKSIDWHTTNITTASGRTLNIVEARNILRSKSSPVTEQVAKEINDAINKEYSLKITNVSIERNMMLAKKLQAVINLVPMPWAWGIFAGRKDNVTAPMIGNLVDIEGFARHINASLNNQGFWGAANEYMLFLDKGTKASYPAFRIMNHLATISRSILSFNVNSARSKRDLEDISKIGSTYSQAEIKLEDNVLKRTNESISAAKQKSSRGFDVFNTDKLDAISVEELLDNEAKYQAEWKQLAGKRAGLGKISLEEALYTHINKTHGSNNMGFLLNQLDKNNSFVGMKIASSKLTAAKWIVGALFIPQLFLTEFGQTTGASLLTSMLAQHELNKGTTNTAIELQSTNFFSAAEIAKMMGADNHLANFVLGTQTLVSMAGISRWAWDHASTHSPEIQAKMFTGEALFNSIEQIDGQNVKGLADTEAKALGKESILAKLTSGKEIAFNVVRENGNITGLKALNAKVAKNLTSFTISLGLTLAAMQTARYLISSAINNERNLMGSAVLSTGLAAGAIAFGFTATLDNMAHTANWLGSGLGVKVGYSNYKVTSMLGKTMLKGLQGASNVFGKHPILATLLTIGAVTGAYWNKLSPFQGDINGPKTDDSSLTAIMKLGKYVELVNRKINDARNSEGGSTSISESISPLEVNGALLAVALGKIINPIMSSQKGSTAYVTAVQSPLPIFQYYSVIKRVVDSNQNSYTTVNLGLQGPPAIGVAPINVSLPIAFALNAKTADNVNIRTGYLGTGLILNEANKDSLSLQDYYGMYSQLALWSSVGITVSSGLARNRLWGRNHQIFKSSGVVVSSESLLTQSLKAGRDKFLGIATLPFYIAAQALNLTTGDLRMPTMRLRATSFVPVVLGAFMGGAIGNHLYNVISTLGQPFVNNNNASNTNENPMVRGSYIAIGAALFAGTSYYRGTIAASRRLASLEIELNVTNSVRFDKRNIDPLISWMYKSPLKGLYRNTLEKFGGFVKNSEVFKSTVISKSAKGFGLLAVGALWNHFITDPTAGKINPELAYGDLTKQGEDNYTNSIRRYTTVAFGAGLFALTAGLSTFNAKSLIFADVNPEHIVEKFQGRLEAVQRLENLKLTNKNKKLTFIQSVDLKYQTFKLNQEAREVQIIIEEGMGNSPIIQAVKTAEGKILKSAFNISDPYSEVKKITSNKTANVYQELQSLDLSAGNDLNAIIKNNSASQINEAINNFGKDKQEKSAVLRALGLNRSASNRIHVERWGRLGQITAGITFLFNGLNWGSQALGYKDFQDVFLGDDENNKTPWADFKKGIVDFVKLQTKHDRAYSYDIAKGLVGPNIHNSKGEFLLSPDTTTKGAINNSLKQLSKLIIVNSPNTFIGVAIGGVTIRPDDNDVRIRDYFQLQSASQDFSSAMYSMSSVFGLQELAKKGFLDKYIIANLRGIENAAGHNQAQMREFASSIITAVYSQPTRAGKDKIKFTAPNKFTLEAMTTNKALAMSLNQRYKRLQALSYGTNINIALYTLMNNMNIASPDMQSKFYKALKDISDNGDGLGLGKLNQNFFMGGEITVKQIGNLASNNNPFTPTKLSIEDTNNENAFLEMQGIAMQSTLNQFDPNKNVLERGQEFFSNMLNNLSIQGVYQGLPPFMWLPLAFMGIASLSLISATIAIISTTKSSQAQVTKDNTALWEQQHKYFDKEGWFSDHPYEVDKVISDKTKFLLIKRSGVVFSIGEGLDESQIKRYTSEVNNLSGALSFKFDTAYRDYAKNYGKELVEYNNQKKLNIVTKLDTFYDELEKNKGISQSTKLSTREERLSRNYGRQFKPVMASELTDNIVIYNNKNQKITEHLLDEFTNKQILDAYLEGQYDAYKELDKDLTKEKFVDKYYKGFTYEQMLDAKSEKFLSKANNNFAGGFNIFGKDRSFNMNYSIEHMTEVYAAKYDLIIDNFYDVIEQRVEAAFIDSEDNIYSKFSSRELNSVEIADEAYVKKLTAEQRYANKIKLREDISNRLNSIITKKKTGVTAIFDRLLNIVSGGTNRDLITRMSLEAGQSAIETMDNIRKYGGGVFQTPDEAVKQEAKKAIELEIQQATNSGLKGSLAVGTPPKSLQSNAALTFLEGMSRLGTALMNGYQAAMFVSTNLITFRAGASIASSKTGEREKEMAREELAKESFENIWSALFFGTLLMNEKVHKNAVPGLIGMTAGYFGYDLLFKGHGKAGQIGAAAVGLSLAGSSIALFKASKTWGVSLGLAGITLLGRSIIDLSSSSVSSISPELGNYITSNVNNFYEGGRSVMRSIQNQSGIINTVGGAALLISGALNFARTRNPINLGISAIGGLISGVGLGYNLDSNNTRLEGASLVGLSGLGQIIITPYLAKKVEQSIVAKTIASWTTENIAKTKIMQTAATFLKEAALKKTVQGMGIRGVMGAARLLGWGVKAVSGVQAGPWGLVASIVWVAGEILWTLLHPESADDVTSNISHWGNSIPGGNLLLKPSNQIYTDAKYKDLDSRNPMFQGTVNDAMKQEWLAQVDTLDDPTGRKTAGRFVTSFDAPMTGYAATSEGYNPGSPDSTQDFAFAIRGKAYNQLITGRQYWNSRMSDKLNQEIVTRYITTTDKLQIQSWNNQINNTVNQENRKITSAPIIGSTEINAISREALLKIAEVSTKLSQMGNKVNEINTKNNLALNVIGAKMEGNPEIQLINNGTSNVQMATQVIKEKDDRGKTKIEFNKTTSPDSQVIALELFKIKRDTKVTDGLINPSK